MIKLFNIIKKPQFSNIFQIFLEVKIWNRDINSGQTVEEVLSGSKGPFKTISLCEESGQGESISFRNDGKGFYTVSEAPDEDEAKDVNVPIFYYSLDEGILRNIAKHFRQPDLKIRI